MRFRSCFLLGLFVISITATIALAYTYVSNTYGITIIGGAVQGEYVNDTWAYLAMTWPSTSGWKTLANITILQDGIFNLSFSDSTNSTSRTTGDYCSLYNYNLSLTITFPNGTVISNYTKKVCNSAHPYTTYLYYPTFNNISLPQGTNITLSVYFPSTSSTVYFNAWLLGTISTSTSTSTTNTTNTTTTTTLPPPPQTPINVALPSWSSTWIDNNTIMIRLSVSWGTVYKISVLNENGTEIPFYASINGWYNGSNAEYTTADCKALAVWRANITYNGETVEGLVIKAGDSAPVNLVLEPYPNEFYDYAIFIHLEGTWEKAVPVVTTSSLPQGGVFDWLTGAFRWLHDALLGTPLKPLVQAFDMLAGIGWGLYNIGKTIVGIVWSVIQVGAKVFPYLGFAILLSFIVLVITRPLDTIHMIMDMIEWIKKTIGAIVEFVAMIAG